MKNKKVLLISISLLICIIAMLIFYLHNKRKLEQIQNKNEEIVNNEVYKINYTEANYNIMIANELDDYIDNNYNFEQLENNKTFEIQAKDILDRVAKEYEKCNGTVEFIKLNDEQYKFTIKTDCNDETNKKVIIKGYSNPFNTNDSFLVVNGLDKTDYGYLASVSNTEIDMSEDGYGMYMNSIETVIKYDENMDEISRYNLKIENQTIMSIEPTGDGNYTALSEDENGKYYTTIFDEDLNIKYNVSTQSDNLYYIREYNNAYYYSLWDKVYKIDKTTGDLTLIKEQSEDDNLRNIKYKNGVLYATYNNYELKESALEIYNDNYEVIKEIKFNGEENFEILTNDSVAVSVKGNTPEDYVLEFYDINKNEAIKSLTLNDILNEIYNLNVIDKKYSNFANVTSEMQKDKLFLNIQAQYYIEEDGRAYTDNILVNIDNETNINFINVYKANYLEEIIHELSKNDIDLSLDSSYIKTNKYIDYITIRLEKDILLYAIYE